MRPIDSTLLVMFKSLILGLVVYPSIIFSQFRIQYLYNSVPDTQRKDSIIAEVMNLDINPKEMKSRFYSASKSKVDSLVSHLQKDDLKKTQFPDYNPNLIYTISKDYNKNSVVFHITYSGVKMKITENERPKWKINKEKKMISNFQCQKASTKYKGRDWTAWFTSEIPISDGPYKFTGLPGIIVSLYDENKEHMFTLIGIKQNAIENVEKEITEKEIASKQLDKILNEGYENVNQNIKDMYINNNGYSFLLNDGNLVHLNKDTKNVEKELANKMRRTKNPIELSPGILVRE